MEGLGAIVMRPLGRQGVRDRDRSGVSFLWLIIDLFGGTGAAVGVFLPIINETILNETIRQIFLVSFIYLLFSFLNYMW